ncbi:hypothetical protein [Rathayibacter rathayi]|uniref:HTH araC/xylS-type domain-containing protein n=1 Tax=Rathayibacter rathayi TaxID=33887 RepID=A0ABX5AET2_RATRA|nr:hypothetical protein [Rathayibacter rathayi]PPH33623.1 hypothetical protein C5C28_10615 [Rathayibacter rathayi]PPH77786.1 hypothetical protein C5C40_06240 [Rathayibacter rathayi]
MHRPHSETAHDGSDALIERGVAVTDRAAEQWLRTNGFDVLDDPISGRVFADLTRSRDFTVARLWHSFARLRARPSETADDLALTFLLEGHLVVATDSRRFTIGKGEGYLRRGGVVAALDTDGSTGTIEIRLGENFEQRFGLCGVWGALPLPATGATRFLTASSNAFLSAFSASGPAWPLWLNALETTVAGTLLEAGRSATMASSAEADILRRARRIIHERCTDRTLTVTALASLVSISERRLFEAFAAAGSTPRAEIERARLVVVRRLTAQQPSRPLDWDDVADRTGFRSSRSLREALRDRA